MTEASTNNIPGSALPFLCGTSTNWSGFIHGQVAGRIFQFRFNQDWVRQKRKNQRDVYGLWRISGFLKCSWRVVGRPTAT
jgi:hypothetical protein